MERRLHGLRFFVLYCLLFVPEDCFVSCQCRKEKMAVGD